MGGPALALDWSVSPPAVSVAEVGTEVSVMLRLRPRVALAERPAAPLDLALTMVGRAPEATCGALREAAEVLRGGLRPGDTLAWAGDGDGAHPDALFARPPSTLAEAFTAGLRRLGGDERADGRAARLLVMVNAPVMEPVDPLLRAASALTDRGAGLDLVCVHPLADLGLLTRLANLGGGEVLVPDGGGELRRLLVARVACLQDQRVLDARLELRFAPGAQPHRLFRVDPEPLFLGMVRVVDDDRRLVLDPGPVTTGTAPPAYLLTMSVPRRRVGRYLLLRGRLHDRAGGDGPWEEVAQRCSIDPAEVSLVEAGVNAARDRVEPTAWVEETAQAFNEGDGRRVSVTLERLVRHFLTLGRTPAVEEAFAMRLRFLRTGALDRAELNRLRRLATTT